MTVLPVLQCDLLGSYRRSRLVSLIGLLVIFSLLFYRTESVGCTKEETWAMKQFWGQPGRTSVTGTYAKLNPYGPDGKILEEYGVAIYITDIVELKPTPEGKCNQDFGPTPLEDPSQQYRHLQVADAECTTEMFINEPSFNNPDIFLNYTSTIITNEAWPNFWGRANLSFVSAAWTPPLNDSALNASYELIHGLYFFDVSPAKLKMSAEIHNWPWSAPDSSLTVYFTALFYNPNPNSVDIRILGEVIQVSMKDTRSYFELNFDTVYLADEQIIGPVYITPSNFSVVDASFTYGRCFCRTTGSSEQNQFDHMIYDPQLIGLFNPNPSKQPQNRVWVAAVATTVPIIFLAGVGAGGFYLWRKKRFQRGKAMLNQGSDKQDEGVAQKSAWTSSTKPSSIQGQ